MGWPGPMTHRQFLSWQIWLRLQWERPSRADWYSIQVAGEVRRIWNGLTDTKKAPDFKELTLKFTSDQDSQSSSGGGKGKVKGRTPEEQGYVDRIEKAKINSAAKSFWFSAVGLTSQNGAKQ